MDGWSPRILNLLPHPVLALDARAKILRANDAAVESLGLPRHDLLGKRAGDFLRSGSTATWCRRRDGSEFPVDLRLSVLDGVRTRLALVVLDRTSDVALDTQSDWLEGVEEDVSGLAKRLSALPGLDRIPETTAREIEAIASALAHIAKKVHGIRVSDARVSI